VAQTKLNRNNDMTEIKAKQRKSIAQFWATWMRLVSAFDSSESFAHNCAWKCERADWKTWLHTGTLYGAHRTTTIFDGLKLSFRPQGTQLHFEEKFGSAEKYANNAVGLWPPCVSSFHRDLQFGHFVLLIPAWSSLLPISANSENPFSGRGRSGKVRSLNAKRIHN